MLKILFPLMAGIVFSCFCSLSFSVILLSLLISSVSVVIALFSERMPSWSFGLSLYVTIFLMGAAADTIEKERYFHSWSGEVGYFEALLLETPHVNGKATRVKAIAERVGRDSLLWARRSGCVYLYFENSIEVEELSAGDKIYFEGRVEVPANAGNPAEFDFEHYMYVNDISGSAYLSRQKWRYSGESVNTITILAHKWRQRIVDIYGTQGFTHDVESLLSALTVGEKRDLSKGVRDAYAAVGASHVLALSGLHLGILYMVLSLLLPFGGKIGRYTFFRELIIISLLWVFAAMAGFTPSIVRAALLFSLMSFAALIGRDVSPVNSLAFAAVVMLVVSPRLLQDISFQLSFAAVFSILLFTRPLMRLMRTYEYGKVYEYFSSLVAVSVAAQIGTLPFVWYYFATFPTYFLMTNMVVVPAAFIIMLLSVVMLLLTPFALLQGVVAWLLNIIITSQNRILYFIESLPFSSLELPIINLFDAYVVAVIIFLFLYSLVNARPRGLFLSLVVSVAALLLSSRKSVDDDMPYVLFYNNSSSPAMQLVAEQDLSYLVTSYPAHDADYEAVVSPFCRSFNITAPRLLDNCCYNSYADTDISNHYGMVDFAGRRIKVLADEHWIHDNEIVPVDCIYLCRGFLGDINELLCRYPTRYIVMDATLYKGSRRRIERECAEAGVNCIDLATRGAVMLLCDNPGVQFVDMRDRN